MKKKCVFVQMPVTFSETGNYRVRVQNAVNIIHL